jgi:hypothetical protein
MKSVIRILLLGLTLAVAACGTNTRPDFLSMSEEEIFAYNLEKPLMDKVYCFEERETSSYIRRRKCMTVEDYVDRTQKAVDKLYTLQPSGPGIFANRRD